MTTSCPSSDLQSLVQQRLSSRPEVRPFPTAVTQLLAACQNPNATSVTFEKIIECDPALSVRLLRMANSPLYGVACEVRGIGHAATLLGIRQLRSLALSVAGAGMFSEGSSGAQARIDLWNHSLGCGTIARLFAQRTTGVEADEAFLAGVFHDVGKLLLLDVVFDAYVKLNESSPTGSERIEAERRSFGISHEEIGLKSAHTWGLPEAIKAAIGFHHRPAKTPVHQELTSIISAANVLARAWALGPETTESEVPQVVLDELGLDSDQPLAELKAGATELFREALQAWS